MVKLKRRNGYDDTVSVPASCRDEHFNNLLNGRKVDFMPKNMEPNNTANQFQLETLEQLFGNFTGPSKWVARKILKRGFVERIRTTLNNTDRNDINNVLMRLVDTAVQQATNVIRWKVALILTIITGVFSLLAVIVTLVIGGSIIIPIVTSVILIVTIWFASGIVSRLIARTVSGMVFKVIEGRLMQLTVDNRE